MGFRFRKSMKLPGGIRINASKSGIGYSYGAKGFRVTKTANGATRTTASIPGTGFSYVEESKGSDQPSSSQHRPLGCGCLLYVLCIPLFLFFIWMLWFLVFHEPDAPPPTASAAPTQPNASVITEPPEKQDIEEYLVGLGYEIIQTRQNKSLLEFMITLPGGVSSDSENWDEIRDNFLNASVETQKLSSESTTIVLYLQDSSGNNCLSASNGKELYNAFEPEPSENADAGPSASIDKDNMIVWISDTGSRYHRDSDCSGLKNPNPVRRSYAVSHGYTACGRCF